ncbi:MAG: FG-GAP-like repeat-containing protein [Acidobacteriota bacterium]|nr:FG-GAP-like repeat-containing protein [Acidobacteriota bacterium]
MKTVNYAAKKFALTMLSAIILVTATSMVFAGKGKMKQSKSPQPALWRQINESTLQSRGAQRAVTPEKYRVFQLDRTSLKNSLADLPSENTDAARETPLIMEVPMPDGSVQRFRMEQTNVISPEIAASLPDWKTFTGYGIDDTTAVGQFDWNVLGFHGYIETDKGIVYIDPYQKGDTKNYLVFYKHEFGAPLEPFVEREINKSMLEVVKPENRTFAPEFSFGTTVRTYRLAIATTGEWSRNAAGVDPTNPTQTPLQIRQAAYAVVITTINRLNGIYTRELASRFQNVNPNLDNNQTNIIFDNPATDPYDNTSGGPGNDQLAINHTTLRDRVGVNNYDIGHLYGTTGGGVAAKASLCDNAIKGQGYSARDNNTGDPFVVDYVAHEMGHQFGGDHTYNDLDTAASNGVCTTRAPLEAFEVASGSTIMSYVGICAAGRNLQQNVDFGIPSFHISSLTVINTNITTGDPSTTACGTASTTINAVPTINAGASYTIPKLTPFELNASATDADTADVPNLLYSWEEYDLAPTSPAPTPMPSPQPSPTPFVPILGASGPGANPAGTYDVDTDGVLRPLFRAFAPRASNARTFPSLSYILNPANNDSAGSNQPPLTYTGTSATGAVCPPADPNTDPPTPAQICVVGERLPTVNRTMNFRVSVRDRRGGVADNGTTVTVAAAAGPFVVNTQNTATAWTGSTLQTIAWDVAGTTGNGINAANVNILLSTDGGQTFPILLSQNTPNDGSEAITIPNIATTTARIKIQPTNNIFFDINNVNFTINAAPMVTRAPFDFDGDGRTDISVFRSSNGTWYLNRSSSGFTAVTFGTATDLIAPADYDGDGKTDISVFRPSNGTWYRINSATNTFSGFQFGQNGDVPRPADFDGDNKADINVFRPSNGAWYRFNSSDGQVVSNLFGQNGDAPVPADYNGDGKADLAVFRPSANTWYIARPTGVPAQNFDAVNFGAAGDIPVPANYDGDTKTDIAVFRPSTGVWYRINSSNGQFVAVTFGQNGDIPTAGDYDGDNKADIAVFRPSNGAWYIMNTQSGAPFIQFGTSSDKPIPAAFTNQ